MSEWISVKDKVPNHDGNLVLWNGYLDFGHYSLRSGKFHCRKHGDYVENVTHWMPLPDAPKDES